MRVKLFVCTGTLAMQATEYPATLDHLFATFGGMKHETKLEALLSFNNIQISFGVLYNLAKIIGGGAKGYKSVFRERG